MSSKQTANMDSYRKEIDHIDDELLSLLDRRMRVAERIAAYKAEHGKRIVDPVRERALLDRVQQESADDMAYYNRVLFSTIMEISSDHQQRIVGGDSGLVRRIRTALEKTPQVFPERATVACQGVAGSFSQSACDRFFKMPSILYVQNFRGVFEAIESGLCQYGVLPVENSTAGSVNRVYELMKEFDFHIVRSTRIKIEQCLLANPGVRKEDVQEIYSHEQAIAQCDDYLKQHFPDARITSCSNTAAAARMIAESGRRNAAAIASQESGYQYGLSCLDSAIQDSDNNYTRFVCLSRDLEIYPGADKTSFMCVTAHTPGALYQVLARLNAAGINIVKLESRPIPSSDFDFRFYFDIDESVYTEAFLRVMGELEDLCNEFRYYGSYHEI